MGEYLDQQVGYLYHPSQTTGAVNSSIQNFLTFIRRICWYGCGLSDQKIELKTFCAKIMNHHQTYSQEQTGCKELPVISDVTQKEILGSYLQIKKDLQVIIESVMERKRDTSNYQICLS
jgi:hypothetical protein